MAKTTTEKKSAKPKPKAKAAASRKAGAKATATAVPQPVRQPGVERRRNHPERAKNGFMHVLLTRDVIHVGKAGDLVKVRPGFARNYLLPKGMATFATPHNLRVVEKHKERLRQLDEARRAELRNLAGLIAKQSITIEANANAEGHLYGSVGADQIAAALRTQNFRIEDENILIEGPLKELGLYTIRVQLATEIETEVKLWVVPTHTDEPTA
jgi:large subunit ribosomal protein L9